MAKIANKWMASSSGGSPGDIAEASYTKTSGVASALSNEVITNLRFQESVVRSFDILASVQIDTTADKWQVVRIIGIQKGSGVWDITPINSGDETGLFFDIVSSVGYGQLVYEIAADASRTAINMKFRAITTSI
jgi:uncharacterized protein YerC